MPDHDGTTPLAEEPMLMPGYPLADAAVTMMVVGTSPSAWWSGAIAMRRMVPPLSW